MATGQRCPYCERKIIVEWDYVGTERGKTAKQWTCSECGKILGVTETLDK